MLNFALKQEYDRRIEEFRSEGSEFLTAADVWRQRGRLWRITKNRLSSGNVLVSGLDWDDVSSFYHKTDTWNSTLYKFLISTKPLQDWSGDLVSLNQKIDKSYVKRVGTVLLSYYEHGMEALGFDIPGGAVEQAAENLSQTLKIPLTVIERGVP